MHIPDRLLQIIGGAYLLMLGAALIKGIKEGLTSDQPVAARDVPLATSHPVVPRHMFSTTFESEDRPEMRRHRSNSWLLTFGDKLCHSTGSLLVYLSQGVPSADPKSPLRRGLFPLYLQGALAETRTRMTAKGVSGKRGDELLNCIAVTILETPLAELDHYARLLELNEDLRSETVAKEAVEMAAATADSKQHFKAAYILLRTVVLVMTSNMP